MAAARQTAEVREAAEARAAVYALVLRKLGVGDAVARDKGTHLELALRCGEYRQRLAAWEAGASLKEAVAELRRIEILSGDLARCLGACPAAVMDLLRQPLPLSGRELGMPGEDMVAMFGNAHAGELPDGPGRGGEWVARLAALSRFCGRTLARMQEAVEAPSADAIARGGRQLVAALRQPHPAWEFAERMLALAERALRRELGGQRGDGARFAAFLDAAATQVLDREAGLADAYGHEFLRTTVRIRTINRRLDSLGAEAVDEKGQLLNERGRLKRRLQEGPRKARRQPAPVGRRRVG